MAMGGQESRVSNAGKDRYGGWMQTCRLVDQNRAKVRACPSSTAADENRPSRAGWVGISPPYLSEHKKGGRRYASHLTPENGFGVQCSSHSTRSGKCPRVAFVWPSHNGTRNRMSRNSERVK